MKKNCANYCEKAVSVIELLSLKDYLQKGLILYNEKGNDSNAPCGRAG